MAGGADRSERVDWAREHAGGRERKVRDDCRFPPAKEGRGKTKNWDSRANICKETNGCVS